MSEIYTEEDLKEFVRCLLAQRPYKAKRTFLNGKASVTFKALTTSENEARKAFLRGLDKEPTLVESNMAKIGSYVDRLVINRRKWPVEEPSAEAFYKVANEVDNAVYEELVDLANWFVKHVKGMVDSVNSSNFSESVG